MKQGLMQYQSLLLMERTGWKPNVEISPNCPRCGSSNTKFCYYNNYSLTQPRYFCKGCRRYWTKGGSLRNVPVGGGCRKNRRGKSIRLSTDIMSSRGFRGLTNHPHGVSHGSSSNSAPPNIDLSMVYANFLNPQPPRSNTSSGSKPQEPTTSNSGLCMDPAISSCMTTNVLDSNVGLPEVGHSLFRWDSLSDLFMDTHLGNDGSAALLFDHPTVVESLQNVPDDNKAGVQECDTDDTSYYMLPPLPSEDIVPREINASWTVTNPSLLVNDHCLQDPEQRVVRSDHQAIANEDPNILIRGRYDDQNQFNFSG